MTELEQYEEDLKNHDWTFEYSDDHRVWKMGWEEQKRLQAVRDRLDPANEIWNKYERN